MSESSIGAAPRRRPLRAPRTTNGACDMFSMPPARMRFASPSSICSAALMIDWMPEPQRRFTVSAVDGVAGGLQGVADDDVLDLLRRDAGAGQCFFGSDDGEVDGADVAEVAVVLGHRRAGAVEDVDVFHIVRIIPFLATAIIPATSTTKIHTRPSMPNAPPVIHGAPTARVVITVVPAT